jgi:protein-ribulosamine 3-kinase
LNDNPCFIHSDLWEENSGSGRENGKLFMFDVNGYFAHHEMDLALWVTVHHWMHEREFVNEYFELMPVTEPAAEAHDRLGSL